MTKLQENLHLVFIISSDSPSGLIWKERPLNQFNSTRGWKIFNKRFANKRVGNILKTHSGKEYWKVDNTGNRKLFELCPEGAVHRIIFIMTKGEIPEGMQIDHRDNNGLNNNPDNLRLASNTENTRNASKRMINPSSKLKGVCKHHTGWRARITVDGKTISLGTFATEEIAHEAYVIAARKYFGKFTLV